MSDIIITRYDEVLETIAAREVAAVLSIEHPRTITLESGYAPVLDNVPQKILSFWDSETPVVDGPDMAQVKAGLAFVLEHIGKGAVIIHCHAGKARSTALALGVLSHLHPERDETALIEQLLSIRSVSAPNILIVEMVDEMTNRHGRLLQAVKDHPVMTRQREDVEKRRQYWLDTNPEQARLLYPEKFPQEGA